MNIDELMPDNIWYGTDIKPSDHTRLASLYDRVVNLMLGEKWWTWRELAETLNASDSSISRMVRYVRQRENGIIVEKQNLGSGLFKYRLKFQTLREVK